MYTDYGRIIQERKMLFHTQHIKYAHSTEDANINILEASDKWNLKTKNNFLSKFNEIEERKKKEQERVAESLNTLLSDPEWRMIFLSFLWFGEYNMSKTKFKKTIFINLFDLEYYYRDYEYLNDSLFKDYKSFKKYTKKNDLYFPLEIVKLLDNKGNLLYPELKMFLKTIN